MSLGEGRRKLLARLRTRKTREREGLFLVEGVRSAGEALDAAAEVTFAALSPRLRELGGGEALAERLARAGVELHEVGDAELASLSDTETPQGVILVCREPVRGVETLDGARRLLVLDGVQDPGNVGTLVRAAAAFALDAVVALDGTADPYNPKVVRASAGGVFRLPPVRARWDEVAERLAAGGVRLLVADAGGEDALGASAAPPWALVVGSEASGVRDEVRAAADVSVRIPMPGGSESLNAAVAASILLYVLTQGERLG